MTTHSCRSTGKIGTRLALVAGLVLLCLISSAQNAVIITNLVSFNGTNGQQPTGGLIQASDGNFYGTTVYGGSNSARAGTIFRLSSNGTFTNMVSFDIVHGGNPNTGVIEGADGNIYGTATYGGAFTNIDPNHNGFGTIFKMTKAGSLSTVASFNGTLGKSPNALVEVTQGTFMGTANSGGAFSNFAGFGYGTIFKATTSGTVTDMVEFDDSNGATPSLGLTMGSGGALFGGTTSGGPFEYGIVFRLSSSGNTFSSQFNFNFTNGAVASSVILGKDGNLYGTAIFGGQYQNGAIFRMSTNLTQFTILANFNGTNGGYPTALLQASDGNFYGLTSDAGAHGFGNFFELTSNNVIVPLYSFTGGSDGYGATSLIQAKDGSFYGTTESGGSAGLGNVFKITVIPAPTITSITHSGNGVNLNWTTVSGMTYDVQYCTDLGHPSWTKLGSTTASGSVGAMSDTIAPGSKRFYRVALNLSKPSGPMIQSFLQLGHSTQFTWNANVGTTYQVQISTDLKNWSTMQSVMASNSTVTFTDNSIGSAPKRFYRLATPATD